MTQTTQTSTSIFSPKTIILPTDLNDITITNAELVTPKVIEIIKTAVNVSCMEPEGTGLTNILFRLDDHPKSSEYDYTWMFYPVSYSAVCSLQNCVDIAIDDSKDDDGFAKFISVSTIAWQNIIQGFFHELHHANTYLQDGIEALTVKEARDEEENRAVEYSQKMLYDLAKSIDLEPEFSVKVWDMLKESMAMEIEDITTDPKASDKNKMWVTAQQYMLENGGVFYDPTDDDDKTYITSFRELLHINSGDAEDDPEWTTPVNEIELVQEPNNEPAKPVNAEVVETVPWFNGVEQNQQNNSTATPAQTITVNVPTPPAVEVTPQAQPGGVQPVQINLGAQPVVNTAPVQNIVVGAQAYQPVTLPTGVNPQDVVFGLYKKLYFHIFSTCKFNPLNPTTPFEAGQSIIQPVQLDVNENQFVKEYTPNEDFRLRTPATGTVAGRFIDKAQTLPGYELTMSTMDGTQIRRKLIPQNPNKLKADGTPTATAALAKAGHAILWIIDPDTKAYNLRIFDNDIQNNVGGTWQNVQ